MKPRRAHEADLPAILAIFNHAIVTSTAIYTDDPQTLEHRKQWFAAKEESGLPVFVVEDADGVAGFGTYGPFRSWPGYRFCVEHSVYVLEAKRRHGHGKTLLATLIETATEQGMHTMIGVIDGQNEASIRLHEAAGFSNAGHLREVGTKFGRWLDVVLMQKILEGPGKNPPS